MDSNGQIGKQNRAGQVLNWTGRVLSAEDVRRSVNGHSEIALLPGTVVTPLAAEYLKERGIRLLRQHKEPASAAEQEELWGVVQERPDALVQSALAAARRDGLSVQLMEVKEEKLAKWAKAVAGCVVRGECRGGVMFCQDAGLVCCVANKVKGVRAMAVATAAQAARAALNLGANLIAVEMPGPTFFVIRQILRTVCCAGPACPPVVAECLQEIEGHAHR